MNNPAAINILLVEDSPSDAFMIRDAFEESMHFDHELVHVESLSDALEKEKASEFSVVLLDLNLPDSQGIETFKQFHMLARHLPIVILTGIDNLEASLESIRLGAQDYLVKKDINANLLSRSIQYAIERFDLYSRIEHTSARLQKLASRLHIIREEERTEIAREVEDNLGQNMSALKMDLSLLEKNVVEMMESADAPAENKQVIRDLLLDSTNILSTTIKRIQDIALELRPGVLDHLGLQEAIRSEVRRFEPSTGIRTLLYMDDFKIEDEHLSTVIFRIFQELMSNVARHSQAQEVVIRLARKNGDVHLDVADNGIGIEDGIHHDEASLGILSITERVAELYGTITFTGDMNNGTHVEVCIPCPDPTG